VKLKNNIVRTPKKKGPGNAPGSNISVCRPPGRSERIHAEVTEGKKRASKCQEEGLISMWGEKVGGCGPSSGSVTSAGRERTKK